MQLSQAHRFAAPAPTASLPENTQPLWKSAILLSILGEGGFALTPVRRLGRNHPLHFGEREEFGMPRADAEPRRGTGRPHVGKLERGEPNREESGN